MSLVVRLRSGAVVALAALLAASCAKSAAPATQAAPPVKEVLASAPVISVANLDTTCAPCKDFNQFANGGWMKNNTIPAAYSRWGAFNELNDRNQAVLHQVLDDAAKNADTDKSPNVRKVGTFYATCMDSTAIEAEGAKPLADELKRINDIKDLAGLQQEIGRLQPDERERALRRRVGAGLQGELAGDPDRRAGRARPARPRLLPTERLGDDRRCARRTRTTSARASCCSARARPRPPNAATRIMAIETALAKEQMARTAMRDPNAIYHMLTLAQFDSLAPNIALPLMLAQWKAPATPKVNVMQPDYLKAVNALLASVPLGDWKAYLRCTSCSDAAPWLSSAFVDDELHVQRRR